MLSDGDGLAYRVAPARTIAVFYGDLVPDGQPLLHRFEKLAERRQRRHVAGDGFAVIDIGNFKNILAFL